MNESNREETEGNLVECLADGCVTKIPEKEAMTQEGYCPRHYTEHKKGIRSPTKNPDSPHDTPSPSYGEKNPYEF